MKKSLLFLPLVLAVVGCAEAPQQKPVLRGKLNREVVAVASKVPGRIKQIFVEEGQRVQKGDTLAIIDAPEIDAKIEQALGAVEAAEAQYQMAFNGATKDQLGQIEAAYEAAQEQVRLAEKSFQRVKNMYEEQLIPEQKFDEVQTKYLLAQAQLEGTAAKRREVEAGVRSEKQRMALGTLKRAKGALKEAQIAQQECVLRAPQTVQLTSIALREGELALPGYNIFIGYAHQSAYFRFTVPEAEIHKYAVGETLEVYAPFADSLHWQAKLIALRELPAYATRKSMYPDYEPDQSLYELKLKPTQSESLQRLLTNIRLEMNKK